MSQSLPLPQSERRSGPYTASAGQTVFTVTFPFLAAVDLQVLVRDSAEDEWAIASLMTDYSVTGMQSPSGGTVTFGTGRAAGSQVRIDGLAPVTSTTDVTPAGTISSVGINRFFDRVVMWLQEIRRDVNSALATVAELAASVPIAVAQSADFAAEALNWKNRAQEWAQSNNPISTEAGGNGTTDRSSRTWALASQSSASAAALSAAAGLEYSEDAEAFADAAAASAASAVEVSGTLPRQPRAAIKALNTGTVKTAYLNEVGREGLWQWTSGNFAALATADTTEAICFAANGVATSLGAWLRVFDDRMNFEWFGAVGDGATDNKDAWAASIALTVYTRVPLSIPTKRFRITEGTTVSGTSSSVIIIGDGRANINGTSADTGLVFDNSDASAFLLRITGIYTKFELRDTNILCQNTVPDQGIFKFANNGGQFLSDIIFYKCGKPIIWEDTIFFSSSYFCNINFIESGTLHSEYHSGNPADWTGSLLTLINIAHTGVVPDNTDKEVMNLSGILTVQGKNVVLQGALPSTGWTVLRINNEPFAPYRIPACSIDGFWSEWVVNSPDYTVDQSSCLCEFSNSEFVVPNSPKYKLDKGGVVRFRSTSFYTSGTPVSSGFEIEDGKCQVIFDTCNARDWGNCEQDLRFTQISCFHVGSGTDVNGLRTSISTNASKLLYEWPGGYFDSAQTGFFVSVGTTAPETDATYGRKFSLIPNGSGGLSYGIYVRTPGGLNDPLQWGIAVKFKLPTYTVGSVLVRPIESSAYGGVFAQYDTSYSGQVVTFVRSFGSASAGVTNVGIHFSGSGGAVLTGNLEIYSYAVYLGKGLPQNPLTVFPSKIVTFFSGAPNSGSWAVGDIIWLLSPTAGGVSGYRCTTAGIGGSTAVFKAISNLAA